MSVQVAGGIAVDVPGADLIGPAPSTTALIVALVVIAIGFVVLWWSERRHAPQRPAAAESPGDLVGPESPAVVNVLTNDATLTAAGFRATVVDLAARGWLRILPPEDDDDLARVRPAAGVIDGDSLLPHERLVLQHVMARFTTDRAIPARFLAVDVRGSWWRRFEGLVLDDSRRLGLTRRRWKPAALVAPTMLGVVGLWLWYRAQSDGDDEVAVIDSVGPRVTGAITIVAAIILLVRTLSHLSKRTRTHTAAGLDVTRGWLGVRRQLVAAGLGPIAPSSVPIGDRRLAYATAMCLADGAATELPLAREDHFRAWSSVGGEGRLVRIKYPSRIGYGLHPLIALAGGLALCFGGLWAYRRFADVARGDALDGLYERFPEQDWLITDIAIVFTFLCVVPILVGLWIALGGAADALHTVERTGIVLRARRPAEVVALPRPIRRLLERDKYVLYIAIDDGSTGTVVAWRTTERNAVPQGVTATVRATTVLGYVRRANPIAHRLPE